MNRMDMEHDPVVDDAAYAEFRRFFSDVRARMKDTGESTFRIATQTKLSRTTLDHYFKGVDKGQRFRISDDVARRLAGWAKLDLDTYQFSRVPRGARWSRPAAKTPPS